MSGQRFPVADLLELTHRDATCDFDAARALGVSTRTMYRWLAAEHLSELQADRAAVRLGLHPAEVWPAWFERVDR